MSFAATKYEHVVLNESDVPILEGTTMKVIELVVEQIAYGWSPEEMHFQHPYLSLGQIHSALAYYWDHKTDLDQAITDQLARVDALRQQMPPSPFLDRIRQSGLR